MNKKSEKYDLIVKPAQFRAGSKFNVVLRE